MAEENWVTVASRAAIGEGEFIGANADGREIAVFDVDGELFATDNICTHGHARLCEGFLEGHEIECPLHQGKFDVRNGKPTCEPAVEALRSYPVKIEGQRVFVLID